MGLFDDKNVVSSNFFKFENVGDAVEGVYVDRKITPNRLRPGTDQCIYTLLQKNGTPINVGGRGQQNPAVLPGMEALSFGAVCGIKYMEDMESKNGLNPAKIIRVFSEGQRDESALSKYQARNAVSASDTLDDEKEMEIPNM